MTYGIQKICGSVRFWSDSEKFGMMFLNVVGTVDQMWFGTDKIVNFRPKSSWIFTETLFIVHVVRTVVLCVVRYVVR